MSNLAILSDIKQQLIERGELLVAHRQFLIDAFSRFEHGEPLEEAFDHAELPCIKRGKESPAYREAERLRNARLRIALEFMPGPSDWKKCEQLAELASSVKWRHSKQPFVPVSEPEKILVSIIEAGCKIPESVRTIRKAIREKSNPD
jgi:hypothetical protein